MSERFFAATTTPASYAVSYVPKSACGSPGTRVSRAWYLLDPSLCGTSVTPRYPTVPRPRMGSTNVRHDRRAHAGSRVQLSVIFGQLSVIFVQLSLIFGVVTAAVSPQGGCKKKSSPHPLSTYHGTLSAAHRGERFTCCVTQSPYFLHQPECNLCTW